MKYNVYSAGLKTLLILAIAIGVGFHFINLDHKIYWHDEVYTSIRAAGFTRMEIDNTIFQDQSFTLSDLQRFQQIKPGSTTTDTIRSLATEDPQHPPLFFLMARGWMHLFGSSIIASRLLPVLLSLLGLPFMYGLAIELFESRLAAWISTVFLALSPFDILFAQTARQYSFLTTIVIASSWLLLRAIRLSGWQHWGWYALSLTVGLYIHPFFTLTIAAQGTYVLLMAVWDKGPESVTSETERSSQAGLLSRSLLRSLSRSINRLFSSFQWHLLIHFLMATVAALALYSPWIWVLSNNMQRASSTTDWTRVPMGLPYLAKLWTLSFTSLFVDVDFGYENPFTILFRLPYLLLIFTAVLVVCRRTPKFVWLFVLTSIFVPFLMLALPDLVMGGQRSAVTRYLISCYPATQLAMAYLITIGISNGKLIWRSLFGLLLTSSIISCWISAQAESWWHQPPSFLNAAVFHVVNAENDNTPTVLLSDIGSDYTNTGDLISLSYNLNDTVRFFLAKQPPNLQPLTNEASVLVFRPSEPLKAAIAQNNWQLEAIEYPPVPDFSIGARLWKLQK